MIMKSALETFFTAGHKSKYWKLIPETEGPMECPLIIVFFAHLRQRRLHAQTFA